MKDWKKTLLGIALAVSVFFNAWPGEKPEIIVDAEPWVDAAVVILDTPESTSWSPDISQIVRVYDGDTIYVDIDNWPPIVGKNIGIRFNGIDTPEIRGSSPEEKKHAILVRDFLKAEIESAAKVEIRNIKRGKYFRIIADVYLDGESVSALLLKKGYAKPYDGGTRAVWTDRDFENWSFE